MLTGAAVALLGLVARLAGNSGVGLAGECLAFGVGGILVYPVLVLLCEALEA